MLPLVIGTQWFVPHDGTSIAVASNSEKGIRGSPACGPMVLEPPHFRGMRYDVPGAKCAPDNNARRSPAGSDRRIDCFAVVAICACTVSSAFRPFPKLEVAARQDRLLEHLPAGLPGRLPSGVHQGREGLSHLHVCQRSVGDTTRSAATHSAVGTNNVSQDEHQTGPPPVTLPASARWKRVLRVMFSSASCNSSSTESRARVAP